ncbi:Energy-coupling factor transporter ATP-binding protein EcfA2 (EcfA2) [Fructobacillus tropaeoli]|uniref:energy-coupling factor transporter ATPase n=1 Tax=Fructobacillus tropaeoli TaxID=709323 RepID=UPI002D99D5A3|nr:Energy-coupling factor transporter ATP-binding protein EcfA2 (EcfA2) [Fructobacillus tropaeoli]
MAINIEGLSFHYGAGKNAKQILDDINLTVEPGQITAIVGQTGSGKSTLVQHLNALLLPSGGQVVVGDQVVTSKTKEKALGPVRAQVGMVFQFPENQLFASTVLEDVMYGPKNFGKNDDEAEALAKKALIQVGLKDEFWQHSPFDLSGGQMRRVALAGVLAMDPQAMVFDEPAAGLDPKGQEELLNLLQELKAAQKTVVLISHQMDQVLALADQVVVMQDGRVAAIEAPDQLFLRDRQWFLDHALDLPEPVAFAKDLEDHGYHFDHLPKSVADLAEQIKDQVDWDRVTVPNSLTGGDQDE